jgi:hypothetical protein
MLFLEIIRILKVKLLMYKILSINIPIKLCILIILRLNTINLYENSSFL